MDNSRGQGIAAMTFGTIIFLGSLAAWLYGEEAGVDTSVLWPVVTPIIGALFIGNALTKTAKSAEQAAIQTNGSMDHKIKSAVSSALADRDSARTRQSQGDISEPSSVLIPAKVVVDAQAALEPDANGASATPH